MRKAVAIFNMLLIVAVLWTMVVRKESHIENGRSIFLELLPRDPRLPLMGDYMELRYAIVNDAANGIPSDFADGLLVLGIEDSGVAHFRRIAASDEKLASNEAFIRFRRRAGEIRIGAEAFTFPEGEASRYEAARYGELRLGAAESRDGISVLVGLRGVTLQPL